jgi:hypothetical protein
VRFADGTPVRVGTIEFVPEAGGPSARAAIDVEGRFVLGTYAAADGAVAGVHRAVIVQHLPAASRPPRTPEHDAHADAADGLVPLPYSQWETTPLRAEVAPRDDNQVALVLEGAR